MFIISLISHCSEFKFVRRPRSSLPDGFKMDKLSGSCYFLERRIPEKPDDNDVLWQKLASPRKRRDASPNKSPRTHRKDDNLNSTPVHINKSNSLEVKDAVTLNGNCISPKDKIDDSLHNDSNYDMLHKDINEDKWRNINHVSLNDREGEEYCLQSFKETSV